MPKNKRRNEPSLAQIFAAATVLTGLGGAILYLLPEPARRPVTTPLPPPPTPADVAPVFKTCADPQTRVLAPIQAAIDRIRSGEVAGQDFLHLEKSAEIYRKRRGYDRARPDMVPNQSYDILERVGWDLQSLGFYGGPIDRLYSDAMVAALGEFQQVNNLPVTTQLDSETLKTLAHKSYHQRVLIGLYTWKASIIHNVPVRDLRIILNVESGGNAGAGAGTSSALGLGQFTNATMLDMIARYGESLGYPQYQRDAADIIAKTKARETLSPELSVARDLILSLRINPELAVRLTALYMLEIGGTQLDAKTIYPRFVLGPTGAQRLTDAPDKPGADLLPQAARANQSLFYRGKIPKIEQVTTYKWEKIIPKKPEPKTKTPPRRKNHARAVDPKNTVATPRPLQTKPTMIPPGPPPRRPDDLTPKAATPAPAATTLAPPTSADPNEKIIIDKKTGRKDRFRKITIVTERVVTDPATGEPVMIWANPLPAAEVIDRIASRVLAPAQLAEADRTAEIMQMTVPLFTLAPPPCPSDTRPQAGPAPGL